MKDIPNPPKRKKDEPEYLICLCVICGHLTGEVTSERNHLAPMQDPDNPLLRYTREGVCKKCKGMVLAGHTAFFSDTRGVILELKANERIQPEYHGKAILVPEKAMDELMAVHKKGPTDDATRVDQQEARKILHRLYPSESD